MSYDSCVFITGSDHTSLMVYILDKMMSDNVTNS